MATTRLRGHGGVSARAEVSEDEPERHVAQRAHCQALALGVKGNCVDDRREGLGPPRSYEPLRREIRYLEWQLWQLRQLREVKRQQSILDVLLALFLRLGIVSTKEASKHVGTRRAARMGGIGYC
eukprot:scaffold7183_cov60-Phaeocystis_antarctica.AAC.7